MQIAGYTVIPPYLLEVYRENCQLERLTVGCLRKQLKCPDDWSILINKQIVKDLNTIIEEADIVAVLPAIAGGC
jgi:molybdopterin converting factor small subunit